LREGEELLDREDPTGAWRAFRRAAMEASKDDAVCQVGLGRAHLMLGRSTFANSYAEAAIATDPNNQDAMALCVRALIRARAFDEAVQRASVFLLRTKEPEAELLASRASALFRVQRTDEAAAAYRLVVGLDRGNAEAHLRLGSGLLPPATVEIDTRLREAVAAAQRGEHERAIDLLQAVLATNPVHPVAHRLLGEVLYAQRMTTSMASQDAAFVSLAQILPRPDVRALPIAEFICGYQKLSLERRVVINRAVALFGKRLEKLVAVGGSHDLLQELDRTTDAEPRSGLRGKRTFDGRVWDDVRGIGGLRAATGIEALDEAAQFGFDTLAHEIAHQVHQYTFSPLQRARITQLYKRAVRDGHCIDYYAASNEMEYFGQGVEAFSSLAKRPGGETTHGHTRFELFRVDPDLHEFVASVVDYDPLHDLTVREQLLVRCVAVALRCGRAADAVVAAEWLRPSAEREALLAAARQALADAECH
jgi:tetratricopeptide (TPR) repeat protein